MKLCIFSRFLKVRTKSQSQIITHWQSTQDDGYHDRESTFDQSSACSQ